MNKCTNRFLTPNLHENTLRFVGDQNGEIYFETMNHTEYDLTIGIFNINLLAPELFFYFSTPCT